MPRSTYITSDEFKRSFEMLCETANKNTLQNKKLTECQIEQKHQIRQIQETQAHYRTIAIGLLFSVLGLAGIGAYTVLVTNKVINTEIKQITVSLDRDWSAGHEINKYTRHNY